MRICNILLVPRTFKSSLTTNLAKYNIPNALNIIPSVAPASGAPVNIVSGKTKTKIGVAMGQKLIYQKLKR